MMNTILIILAILISIIISATYIAFLVIYVQRKLISIRDDYLTDGNFTETLTILQTIVSSELRQYEQDVFKERVIITNSNFEEYYKDLTSKVIDGLSPQLINNLTKYLTEDYIYRLIARTVKEYLQKKIGETL